MPPVRPDQQSMPAEIQSVRPTVLHLQPDDVLLVGRLDGGVEAARFARTELLKLLPSVRDVVVFSSDIDVKVLREVEADLAEAGDVDA